MSKKSQEAIERQQYTPKFIAGVCGNCAYMKVDLELPAWMKKQPGVWGDEFRQEKNHRCAIGGFSVKKLGSCAEHAFSGEQP